MTIMDKKIIKKKIEALRIFSQEDLRLNDQRQINDVIHDIIVILLYLYDELEKKETTINGS